MLVKLYIGDVGAYLVRKYEKTPLDVHSVQIIESESQSSEGVVIDTVKYTPGAVYVETHKASDNSYDMWYRVRFISDPTGDIVRVFGVTDWILPEYVAGLVDELRSWIGDVDISSDNDNFSEDLDGDSKREASEWKPLYSDEHYVNLMRYALKRHKGVRNLSLMMPEDWVPIKILVMIELCLDIAFDYSKYYALSAPGNANLNLNEISKNYLETAEALRRNYSDIVKSYNMDNGGYDEEGIISQMPAVQEGNLYRYSRVKGRIERDPLYLLRQGRRYRF